MRRSFVTAAAFGSAVALCSGAQAAPAPQLTDPTGDANGVNSQSIGLPLPSQSAPVGVAAADIVSAAFTTTYAKVGRKQVPRGVRITLTTAAAPQENTVYNVSAVVASTCDGKDGTELSASFQLVSGGAVSSFVNCGPRGSTSTTDIAMGEGVVDASARTVTWQVDGSYLRPGAVLSSISADTSVFVVGVYDDATSAGTYTYK